MKSVAAIAIAACFAATPSLAQDSRYVLERTETGFVRMDTETGAMSVCEVTDKKMICRLAADERRAFEDALDEMHERLTALEVEIAALGGGRAPSGAHRLPDDKELDETFSVMEKFFRRFMGIAKDLEREFGTRDPQPLPDRT